MSPELTERVISTIENQQSLMGAAIELLLLAERLTDKMPQEQRIALAEFVRSTADRVEHRPRQRGA